MKPLILLMLLVVTFFFTTTQGRSLRIKSTKLLIDTPTRQQVDMSIRSDSRILIDRCQGQDFTTQEDCRSTTPGHSPGVGH
ncbi:hypothetical protein HanXRQr2_Chr02g0056431 [Helianthus annuus]|uniref:Uncharacterized protein n=1 Tax=Helianthus annuus TaxID=4232 RepID=A0A9K3JMN4_HELAN|nr:hypothetical protein HanXRQr2_Chr02g0056431 [Helianthus annuus]KAJ0951087.1 hypothetical protein HanPSC8_Chr02g0055821 [Helianthus annuus]